MPRRRYSREKKQEQISRAQLKDFLESHEWITGDIEPDLGEDILVRIYDQGISTGLSLYVQLKSVQDIEGYRLKSGVISYRFKVADLEHWENHDPPLFIVVWDINKKEGWWIGADEAILNLDKNKPSWRRQNKVRVHIPRENQLDESGLRRIRHLLADRIFPLISKDKGLDIQAKFEFPPTPEGKAKLAEFERHLAAGDEVEIDGQFIIEFEMPGWWVRLYGELDPKSLYLHLGATKSPTMLPVQIDFFSPQFGNERIPYVEFRSIKEGQEEATISNEYQNIPATFHIILNKLTRQMSFTTTFKFSNVDALTAFQAVRIQQILASGGVVRITRIDTGESDSLPIRPGTSPPPNEVFVKFIENLRTIQRITGKVIRFPHDAGYSLDDVIAADELVSIISTGRYRQKGLVFTAELRKPAISMIVKAHKRGEPIRFQLLTEGSFVKVFLEEFELGPIKQFITGKWDMPIEGVISWLENAADEDALKVRLVDVEMYEEFEDWLNKGKILESGG
jgi:hypothetical protein